MRFDDDATLLELARTYHTPLYVFDEATIRAKCAQLKAAITYPNHRIRYACKALTLQAVLKIILDEGLWIDASSLNEVHRALRAGFNPAEIYYTGEGATREVYGFLVEHGILINCTSIDQIRLLGSIRPGLHCSIRINPGEGHGETTKTNTGGPSSKHGIYFDQMEEAKSVAASFGIRLVGVHSHIGSGTDLKHWLTIKDKTLAIAEAFPDLEFVNLGGGLPVVYNPATDKPMPLREWGAALSSSMAAFSARLGRDIRLFIEPGRFVVAESGLLLAEVQAIKETPGYRYAIVNTGHNHNIRPAMYGSWHPIRFIAHDGRAPGPQEDYVVAGYLCESGDVFTVTADGTLAPRPFPRLAIGDLMVMGHVGAYSHAMKSEYNSMNLPASVLIDRAGRPVVIERRGTLADIMRREVEAYSEGRGEMVSSETGLHSPSPS
ncbi:MAG TPA: diaminopimelate decarboxylase [Rhodopila sp.]|uniref:diaminopimelate decarboxylase n=1 Tax=Rhodopila sp. TaxID=2480087 RepID=UPI002C7C28A2|nr:diaminopimelate decarboxylase [Rhodopila sp.]HVY14443.1 diaminopimelate decarboxylase [Rhodopila sp.]